MMAAAMAVCLTAGLYAAALVLLQLIEKLPAIVAALKGPKK